MERRKKGTGQITKVNETTRKSPWKAQITINGKRKTKYFKTEKEAKKWLQDINSDISKKQQLLKNGVTFSVFAPTYLNEKSKSGMKVRSFDTESRNIKRVEQYLGHMMLSDLDNDCLQNVIYEMAEAGYSKSILDKSKNAAIRVLKMAAAKHYIATLPTFDITIPTAKTQEPDRLAKNNWLKKGELEAYIEECKRTYVPQKYTKNAGQTLLVHEAGHKLLFLLHTGMRMGEALALTWDDYDECSKTILIDKNLAYTKNGKITQTPKTVSGERLIVLNRQAVEDLEMLRKQFDKQAAIIEERMAEELKEAEKLYGPAQKAAKREIKDRYATIKRNHKYICGSSTFPFGSGSHSGTKQTHDKICKSIGLSHKVTAHGLRHTYVTHYYLRHKNDADFDLATFSKSIGHASVRTTMEVYAHLELEENRHIPRALSDLKDF